MLKAILGLLFGLLLSVPAAHSADNARVVVLKWPGTELGYSDADLQRVVKSRTARANAVFSPSVDLFQNGRKHPDRSLNAAAQPARVSAANLAAVKREVDRVAQIPWNRLNEGQWAQEARTLKDLVDQIWFVESPEQRDGLFMLYAQAGRAAWFQGSESPPYFEAIGGTSVNYFHYLAAVMASEDPSLMGKLSDQELHGYISQYLDQLNADGFPSMDLDFELENHFDLKEFAGAYKIFLNGMEVEPNERGQIRVPLGRTDIFLQAADGGFGLSERLVVDKLADKAFFVRDVARKSMGIDFIEKLMENPNECSPELEERMHVYLSIYSKLHPNEDIYVAVPQDGKMSKLSIWRFDRQGSTLQLVGGGDGGFPVRFGAVAATGSQFNTWMVEFDPTITGGDIQDMGSSFDADAGASIGGKHIPVNLELRLHYNRWMLAFGTELGVHLGDGWVERYSGTDGLDVIAQNKSGEETLNTRSFNVLNYMSLGVLLGKDAGIGFGPRAAIRFGKMDMPRAGQVTLHGGYTHPAPGIEADGRIRPFIDADFRAGLILPLTGSLQLEADGATSQPTFGMTAGVGTTF
jgi:hypothetical protein